MVLPGMKQTKTDISQDKGTNKTTPRTEGLFATEPAYAAEFVLVFETVHRMPTGAIVGDAVDIGVPPIEFAVESVGTPIGQKRPEVGNKK